MEVKQYLFNTLVGLSIGLPQLSAITSTYSVESLFKPNTKPTSSSFTPVKLASKYRSSIAHTDFYMSEKFDGIRAYWDGTNFYTRSGRKINAPAWFTENFPNISLDGELWIAHAMFDKVSSIIRSQNATKADWQAVKFMVFDLPSNQQLFNYRWLELKRVVKATNSKYIQLVEQYSIAEPAKLEQFYNRVVSKGGEGVMLQHRNSAYMPGRSQHLFKLKPFDDDEAVVLKYLSGKGKYVSMMGALQVQNKQGQIFKIGSGFTDQQRVAPPAIGSVITYRYRGRTSKGLPRFATFLRLRESD
jgi:DNA ligase 1